MIEEWTAFINSSGARNHVVFLSDHDILMTQRLVQGVDLWINTPRRPWEACGTSGMKVLANGGINLSELDGWWAEAYKPELGWALGDGREHGDDTAWEAQEAEDLYGLLEEEVIPAFYARDEHGIPRAWVARMRESMARLTPRFSSNRAVRQYTEEYYIPAAKAYHERVAEKRLKAAHIVSWQRDLAGKWANLRFGEVKVETRGKSHLFMIHVYLNKIDPDDVSVQLYADGMNGEAPARKEMSRGEPLVGAMNGYVYRTEVAAARPAADYTARIIPRCPGATVPLEARQIFWQR